MWIQPFWPLEVHACIRKRLYELLLYKSYSRIDLFLTDLYTLHQISNAEILAKTWSDHVPITMTLQEKHVVPLVFLWHNNTSLYTSSKHKLHLQEQITEFFQLNSLPEVDDFTLWCSHKAYSRGLLLQLSSRERKRRLKALSTILDKTKAFEALHNRNLSPQILNKLQNTG